MIRKVPAMVAFMRTETRLHPGNRYTTLTDATGDLLDCFGINARDIYLYQRSAKRASTGHTGKIEGFIND
ncbi:hypothetical protein NY035_07215 [Corynebacterium diphtheriae bv. mitis]|uniref:hypothetical protein n=1 Tax=Corynebacterium diphtheriae TaxID=1717 RepID=UPI001FD3760B|nr:hypothetical protein [Corynebacterium diphtheriae]UWE83832.1 hypothetical protein NY053_11420 [Corynebacterium diphtheriae bv. mitis]UWE92038.1 hypothetical protein NY044_11385 [Corynebacterium diphtheriae bv. mitis]UWE96148.1 hypothetical protein NY039_10105 [Corynebacterium diphtheriae bv. mitis]UWE97817.1 hypothetical protein NY040_07215 [Corynebacterium diphtheriae bv. mitis]UWF01044.1 hypothetical protein NY052_01060 [Corynebacterium diphtheriae bv. mitis]